MDKVVEFEGKLEGKPDEGSYVAVVGGTDGSSVDELVELRGKVEEAVVAPVGKVGGATVWPKQLPLLIITSSMAKSPVYDDPLIPSNVT